eukprot:1853443-Alexandrium_andersonii.AAC.1
MACLVGRQDYHAQPRGRVTQPETGACDFTAPACHSPRWLSLRRGTNRKHGSNEDIKNDWQIESKCCCGCSSRNQFQA